MYDKTKIIADLYNESRFYDCFGCEMTEEDADYVIALQKKGHPYAEAIEICLNGIDATLGY